jgi:hypothetical protein
VVCKGCLVTELGVEFALGKVNRGVDEVDAVVVVGN